MNFTCTVTVNAPLEEVTRLFNDERHLREWQDGYVGTQLLRGQVGKVGAQSKISFKQGKRSMELLETLQVVNLPHEKTALYEHAHMTNSMQNLFTLEPDGSTRYTANIQYTEFHGLIPKMMVKFFPGIFKKQVQKWLTQFKVFVERSGNRM